MKKALTWLKTKNISFDFHDYKTKGISEDKLLALSKQVGWESLVNKKGTTWRQLDDVTKASIKTEAVAISLMMAKTSVIKRPLIEKDGKVILLGFDDAEYKRVLNK